MKDVLFISFIVILLLLLLFLCWFNWYEYTKNNDLDKYNIYRLIVTKCWYAYTFNSSWLAICCTKEMRCCREYTKIWFCDSYIYYSWYDFIEEFTK